MKNVAGFHSDAARRLAGKFERDLARSLANIPARERDERIAEATAHLQDAVRDHGGDEVSALRAAIAAFGPLPDAGDARRTALVACLRFSSVIAVGVLSAIVLFALPFAIAEIANPDATGFWIYPSGDWSLSFEIQEGAREAAGGYFAPALFAIIAAAALSIAAIYRAALSPRGALSHWEDAKPA
ncbi:MAG: hypothetical protein ACOZAA_00405 [Pseudomonadota bacterium]